MIENEEVEYGEHTQEDSRKRKKAIVGVVAAIIVLGILSGSWFFIVHSDEVLELKNIPGEISPINVLSNKSVKATFGPYNQRITPLDIMVVLEAEETSERIELTFPSAPSGAPFDMTANGAINTSCSAIYYDYNYQENIINFGDWIQVDGLQPNTTYSLYLYHYDSNSICAMVYGQTTFTVPP